MTFVGELSYVITHIITSGYIKKKLCCTTTTSEWEYICTCLFANTSSAASLSSSSDSIRQSSSLASPILSLSLLSTTKMRPEKEKEAECL